MKTIGITGGTGAGKTTALRVLAALGGAVIDCDAVYHALLLQDDALKAELIARFGEITTDGAIDRKKLGAVVFRDAGELRELNAITHRYVDKEVKRLLQQAAAEERRAVAVDAIALFESGLSKACDVTVGVLASREGRVARIVAREGIAEEYARLRIEAQQPDSFYEERCDHILRNDADEAAFAAAARELFLKILSES